MLPRRPPLEGATDTLNRITQGGLEKRYHEKVVHFESAERAYSLVNKDDNDTLRSIAIRSGRKLGVEKVIAGTIWRFTERKGNAIAAESPASVAFSLFLINVAHGDIIWNGIFNETQKALTEKLSPKPLPMTFPTIAINARTTVKSIKSLLWGMCK